MNNSGLTIIILSYNRRRGLGALLSSITKQERDFPLEVIVWNNFHQPIPRARWSKLGKLLNKFDDVRVIDSSFNYGVLARYVVVRLAKYETICFLDDDIELISPTILKKLLKAKQEVGEWNLLSCWNNVITAYSDKKIELASMGFTEEYKIDGLIETDIAGPGVAVFDNKMINEEVLGKIQRAINEGGDDMAFSLYCSQVWKSKNYYLSTVSEIGFHQDSRKQALYNKKGLDLPRYREYVRCIEKGYEPVVQKGDYKKTKASKLTDDFLIKHKKRFLFAFDKPKEPKWIKVK